MLPRYRRLNHGPTTPPDSTNARTTPHVQAPSSRRAELMAVPHVRGGAPRLTKLLLHVTIERSLGPVHVVTEPDNTVGDLIKAALEIYTKEKRRPLLTADDPGCFQLHYSQFSLESLRAEEKLINLGSRNFFLWCKPSSATKLKSSACCDDADNKIYPVFSLLKFMDLLL